MNIVILERWGFSINSIHTICFSWCQRRKPVHENKQMGLEGLLLSAVQLFGLLSSYMPKNYLVTFDNLQADIGTRFSNFSDSEELKTV